MNSIYLLHSRRFLSIRKKRGTTIHSFTLRSRSPLHSSHAAASSAVWLVCGVPAGRRGGLFFVACVMQAEGKWWKFDRRGR